MLSRQFLSVKDVADLRNAGEVAVRPRIRAGELRTAIVGRKWRMAPKGPERFPGRRGNRLPDGPDRISGTSSEPAGS